MAAGSHNWIIWLPWNDVGTGSVVVVAAGVVEVFVVLGIVKVCVVLGTTAVVVVIKDFNIPVTMIFSSFTSLQHDDTLFSKLWKRHTCDWFCYLTFKLQ